MLKQYHKIKDKLDISKRLPEGYFNKWLLNGVFIFLLLAWFFMFSSNGFNFDFYYVACEQDICKNPLLEFESHPLFNEYPELKTKEFLYKGESYGRPFGIILQYFDFVALAIIFLAFCVNHALFKAREEKAQ